VERAPHFQAADADQRLLPSFSAPGTVSPQPCEVPPFWRRGRSGQDESAAVGAIRQASSCRVGFAPARRTYPELESSLLAYFRRDVPRKFYRSYNESKHIVSCTMDRRRALGIAATKMTSISIKARVSVHRLDELTHFTLKQWQFLTSRNRLPVPGSVARMAGASNPATSPTPG